MRTKTEVQNMHTKYDLHPEWDHPVIEAVKETLLWVLTGEDMGQSDEELRDAVLHAYECVEEDKVTAAARALDLAERLSEALVAKQSHLGEITYVVWLRSKTADFHNFDQVEGITRGSERTWARGKQVSIVGTAAAMLRFADQLDEYGPKMKTSELETAFRFDAAKIRKALS